MKRTAVDEMMSVIRNIADRLENGDRFHVWPEDSPAFYQLQSSERELALSCALERMHRLNPEGKKHYICARGNDSWTIHVGPASTPRFLRADDVVANIKQERVRAMVAAEEEMLQLVKEEAAKPHLRTYFYVSHGRETKRLDCAEQQRVMNRVMGTLNAWEDQKHEYSASRSNEWCDTWTVSVQVVKTPAPAPPPKLVSPPEKEALEVKAALQLVEPATERRGVRAPLLPQEDEGKNTVSRWWPF